MQTKTFAVKSNESFVANRNEIEFIHFHHNKEENKIKITSKAKINLEIKKRDKKELSFKSKKSGFFRYKIDGLIPNANYKLSINGKITNLKVNNLGNISFKTN